MSCNLKHPRGPSEVDGCVICGNGFRSRWSYCSRSTGIFFVKVFRDALVSSLGFGCSSSSNYGFAAGDDVSVWAGWFPPRRITWSSRHDNRDCGTTATGPIAWMASQEFISQRKGFRVR